MLTCLLLQTEDVRAQIKMRLCQFECFFAPLNSKLVKMLQPHKTVSCTQNFLTLFWYVATVHFSGSGKSKQGNKSLN